MNNATDEERLQLAASVRDACVAEALEAWEQAGMSGLCAEGRWDLVIDRLRSTDAETLLRRVSAPVSTRS